MVSISNVDLVMAALRARLQRLAKEKGRARTDRATVAGSTGERSPSGEIGSLRQLAPREFDRALIGLLLEAELGEGLNADPRFRALVDRTSSILESDPEIQALFRQVQLDAR